MILEDLVLLIQAVLQEHQDQVLTQDHLVVLILVMQVRVVKEEVFLVDQVDQVVLLYEGRVQLHLQYHQEQIQHLHTLVEIKLLILQFQEH